MQGYIRNRKVIIANTKHNARQHFVTAQQTDLDNGLDNGTIHEVNRMLAREFIESRLDAPATEANIEKLASLIAELEQTPI